MSDAVLVALIAATPPTILAIISLFKIEKVHKATNSMKDALIVSTEKEALARGKIVGIAEEKQRNENP